MIPVWLAMGCAPEPPGVEALITPEDPAALGMPVGVRTITIAGLSVDVWYPASDDTTAPPADVDFMQWVPDTIQELLPEVVLPAIPSIAIPDAPVRRLDAPLPALVFSHGFGGTRAQSVSLTAHLAGRGYVVVSADHPGRSMPDLLPCLFTTIDGCNLAFDDPAVAHVSSLADWLDAPDSWIADLVDAGPRGLLGHSAGGVTTMAVGNDDLRFGALAPMAGGAALTRSVPTQRWAGTCDATVPASTSAEAHAESGPEDVFVELLDGGHLAFADLCALGLGDLADDVLADHPDVSALFLDQLRSLATDGCPGEVPPELPDCGGVVLDPADADPLLRAALTDFFDAALGGAGALIPDPHPDLRITE